MEACRKHGGGAGGGGTEAALRGGPVQENRSVGRRAPGCGMRAPSALALLTRSTEASQQLLVLAGETWAEEAAGLAARGSRRRPTS